MIVLLGDSRPIPRSSSSLWGKGRLQFVALIQVIIVVTSILKGTCRVYPSSETYLYHETIACENSCLCFGRGPCRETGTSNAIGSSADPDPCRFGASKTPGPGRLCPGLCPARGLDRRAVLGRRGGSRAGPDRHAHCDCDVCKWEWS